ncbi:MAG: hypothetical protein AB9872_15725 [Solidesulfovibrio sp.]
MSASVRVMTQADKGKRAVEADSGRVLDEKNKLAVAVEALSAIAGENDLTCMRAMFRMRRQAEEALLRIRATYVDKTTLS